MGPDERNPLLNDVKQTLSTRKVVKLCIVLSMLALNIFGSEFYVYSRNEWLWNKEQRDFFPNESVSVGKSCGEVNHSDPNYDKHAKVQDATARWHMYMSVGSKSISLFTTFIYTAYTDYYGRRFLFILTSFGMFINNASTALVIHFDANPVYLVVAEILYGLSGTMFGFHAAAYSLIADVTSPGAQRSTGIFLVATSIVLGKALGTLTAGFYIEYSGYFYPALTSAALLLLLFILSVSVIPETLSEEGRIIRPSFIFIIKRPFAFYTSSGFRQVRCSFLLLLFAFALMDMTSSHRRQFETLYQLGRPFCWKPTQIAVFATAVSLGENVIGVGFIKLLHRYVTDVTISLLGTVTNAVSLTVESLATNSLLMYICKYHTLKRSKNFASLYFIWLKDDS